MYRLSVKDASLKFTNVRISPTEDKQREKNVGSEVAKRK